MFAFSSTPRVIPSVCFWVDATSSVRVLHSTSESALRTPRRDGPGVLVGVVALLVAFVDVGTEPASDDRAAVDDGNGNGGSLPLTDRRVQPYPTPEPVS